MQRNVCSLTVFFEDPFWVGVLQRTDGTRLEVCKITFGAEPKDYEVYEFLLTNWGRFRFSPMLPDDGAEEKKVNPKRMRRAISRELQKHGVSTKAQMALQLQRESAQQRRIHADLKDHISLVVEPAQGLFQLFLLRFIGDTDAGQAAADRPPLS